MYNLQKDFTLSYIYDEYDNSILRNANAAVYWEKMLHKKKMKLKEKS